MWGSHQRYLATGGVHLTRLWRLQRHRLRHPGLRCALESVWDYLRSLNSASGLAYTATAFTFAFQMVALNIFLVRYFSMKVLLGLFLDIPLLCHFLWFWREDSAYRAVPSQWLCYSWMHAAKVVLLFCRVMPRLPKTPVHTDPVFAISSELFNLSGIHFDHLFSATMLTNVLLVTPVLYALLMFRLSKAVFSPSSSSRITVDLIMHYDMLWHVVIDMVDEVDMFHQARLAESIGKEGVREHQSTLITAQSVIPFLLFLSTALQAQALPGVLADEWCIPEWPVRHGEEESDGAPRDACPTTPMAAAESARHRPGPQRRGLSKLRMRADASSGSLELPAKSAPPPTLLGKPASFPGELAPLRSPEGPLLLEAGCPRTASHSPVPPRSPLLRSLSGEPPFRVGRSPGFGSQFGELLLVDGSPTRPASRLSPCTAALLPRQGPEALLPPLPPLPLPAAALSPCRRQRQTRACVPAPVAASLQPPLRRSGAVAAAPVGMGGSAPSSGRLGASRDGAPRSSLRWERARRGQLQLIIHLIQRHSVYVARKRSAVVSIMFVDMPFLALRIWLWVRLRLPFPGFGVKNGVCIVLNVMQYPLVSLASQQCFLDIQRRLASYRVRFGPASTGEAFVEPPVARAGGPMVSPPSEGPLSSTQSTPQMLFAQTSSCGASSPFRRLPEPQRAARLAEAERQVRRETVRGAGICAHFWALFLAFFAGLLLAKGDHLATTVARWVSNRFGF